MPSILIGKSVKGQGLGSCMGFPTLNIPYYKRDSGVYVGKTFIDKLWQKSVIHVGGSPTVNRKESVCEIHLIDWNGGDIALGTEIKVEFLEKIRDTEKFKDLDELKDKIAKDVEFVKEWYNRS